MSFFDNTRKPVGVGGRMMVSAMNLGHRALADWGFGALDVQPDAMVLGSARLQYPPDLAEAPHRVLPEIDRLKCRDQILRIC